MNRKQWSDWALKVLLGVSPLVLGTLFAVGMIALILELDPTITTVYVSDITVGTEEGAAQAHERLANGDNVERIAEDLGEDVDSFDASIAITDNILRRKRLEDDTAADAIFGRQATGTVLGPYETRAGYYVLRIESQDIVRLSDINTLIDDRILQDTSARASVVNFWLPIFLCSCGLVLTFSAGLWNIGIEGQVGIGAVAATSVALFADLPREQMIISELVLAAAAGGVWAFLAAIMRTRAGVNEIFGGVALNFIATGFSSALLTGSWGSSSGSSTPDFPEKAMLPSIDGLPLSPITLTIAAICFVFVLFAMTLSPWGLQLRAIGKNEVSARVLGTAAERNVWLSMILCGMMAGVAGAHLVVFTRGNLPATVSGGIGFLALLVVLLAAVRIVLVPFISIVFALLTRSNLPLRTNLEVDSALVGVFIGILVFNVLLFAGVRQRLDEFLTARQQSREKALGRNT